jgi:hypothetical protein
VERASYVEKRELREGSRPNLEGELVGLFVISFMFVIYILAWCRDYREPCAAGEGQRGYAKEDSESFSAYLFDILLRGPRYIS